MLQKRRAGLTTSALAVALFALSFSPGAQAWMMPAPKAALFRQHMMLSNSKRTLSNKVRMVNGEDGEMKIHYKQIEVDTKFGISLFDITPQIKELVQEHDIKEGYVNVLSRHTTTAVTLNEMEDRLVDDFRQWLLKLAPPSYPYLHNDLHLRKGPEGWPGGDEAWREQEPINAHSHLLAMTIGQSETIPVSDGKIMIGTWQSVILVELDGPRKRTVGLQVVGK
eukprot:CAMPEP_0113943648 /NCGR_PEP_ID=MMETSP1339-20121228/26949_1 /TAXON_ID=94617 /ORGANISM="Fibrocapsa japonica" /LENGTH=222 /DNA_ID=CAMNT_0000948585 /DNA_START=15 /DNA_END=683 /DNA_ORIENTATION=+ /assembly_acc=CAM_ASM_000762